MEIISSNEYVKASFLIYDNHIGWTIIFINLFLKLFQGLFQAFAKGGKMRYNGRMGGDLPPLALACPLLRIFALHVFKKMIP